ncbi:MAG: tetratricopeptide repeat protein [Verrucomicrobiaceae bacterium]|nr:tetratricopeptide repeat protein [Verrucomicrobiaceae bacterium]
MSHPPHNPLAPHSHTPEGAELQPQVSALEAFLDKHFRTILYACVAAVVGTGIFQLVKYRSHLAATEAAAAATAAKTVDDCDIVIQKYKGSVAAGNALLTKAKLLWDQNKKDPAVAALREFTSNYSDHPFIVQGLLALGSRLESMGGKDAAEAKTVFETIVSKHKDSEVAGLAQLRIADLLWSEGKEAEAKAIYDELPRKFIGQFGDRVQERVDWLAAALPTKEVEGPKIPDALKAPAPAPGAAPAINITPGKDGSPFGAMSKPFEVKAQPAPAPAATATPAPNAAKGPDVKATVPPAPKPPTPQNIPVNPGAKNAPPPAPTNLAPATSAPVQAPKDPAPAPAKPAAPAAPAPAAPAPAKPEAK